MERNKTLAEELDKELRLHRYWESPLDNVIEVWTSDYALDEQENWPEEDESKNVDFESAPYWLMIEQAEPEGYHDLEEVAQRLFEIYDRDTEKE